jgi:hypothetical protein
VKSYKTRSSEIPVMQKAAPASDEKATASGEKEAPTSDEKEAEGSEEKKVSILSLRRSSFPATGKHARS